MNIMTSNCHQLKWMTKSGTSHFGKTDVSEQVIQVPREYFENRTRNVESMCTRSTC